MPEPARPTTDATLLQVIDLTVQYGGRGRGVARAVDGVNLSIQRGETVGLVGESGSGKSSIGRSILGLAPVSSGRIVFDGQDITRASYRERRKFSSRLQVVFQDPYSSLNPTRTVGQTLGESIRAAERLSKSALEVRVRQMLEKVGLDGHAASRYPAQFSGGQRQRIAIARALMSMPELVICDEAVSALDLSVQAQVINLLRRLQEDFGLSYLFIAHDLPVVRHICDRVVVLFRGQVMEEGPVSQIYENPVHPYTRALLAAAPVADPVEQRLRRLSRAAYGSTHDLSDPGFGCPFVGRCPAATETCARTRPELEASPGGTSVACHRWREIQADDHVAGLRETTASAPRSYGRTETQVSGTTDGLKAQKYPRSAVN